MNKLIELKPYVNCSATLESGLRQFPYIRNNSCQYIDDVIELLVQGLGSKYCTVTMQNKDALTANYIIENVNSLILKNEYKLLNVDKIELWVNNFINGLGIYVKMKSIDGFLDEMEKMISKGKLNHVEAVTQ